jgi:hypothetical protein
MDLLKKQLILKTRFILIHLCHCSMHKIVDPIKNGPYKHFDHNFVVELLVVDQYSGYKSMHQKRLWSVTCRQWLWKKKGVTDLLITPFEFLTRWFGKEMQEKSRLIILDTSWSKAIGIHPQSTHSMVQGLFVCLLYYWDFEGLFDLTLMIRTLPPTPLHTLQFSPIKIYCLSKSFFSFFNRYDLELHLVHYSSQGGVAVSAIVYKYGRPDRFLSRVLWCLSVACKYGRPRTSRKVRF